MSALLLCDLSFPLPPPPPLLYHPHTLQLFWMARAVVFDEELDQFLLVHQCVAVIVTAVVGAASISTYALERDKCKCQIMKIY